MQVEQILRIQFGDDKQFQKFLEEVWEAKIDGRSTVKSLCKHIEETRKSFGNLFKIEYEKLKPKYSSESKKKALALAKKDEPNKEIQRIVDTQDLVYEKISSFLKKENLLNVKYLQKSLSELPFANPFSLAQLYNLLETDRHGFNKLCKACILENSWRGTQTKSLEEFKNQEDKKSKRDIVDSGVRLSADTGRPFDGQIDKLISRVAWEISKVKLNQIKPYFQDGDTLEIPIIVEYNQFNFTEQI